MGVIRPFREEDIPQIIELNTRLFPGSAGLTKDEQEYRFKEICLHNAWQDPRITSLVHEETNGRISGFIGIVPRKVELDGRVLTLGSGQHLMVDKATLAALQLFKAFIAGPQDISIADMAADVTKRLWERLGGSTMYAQSIYWRKALRPMTTAAKYFGRSSSAAALLNPFASAGDALLNRKSLAPLHIAKPKSANDALTIEIILSELPKFTAGRRLVPSYTKESLTWLFHVLSKERRFGSLRKILVRGEGGAVLGWYVYFLNPSGRSEVLQIAATSNSINEVLENLFYDAWEQGSTDLSGRVDPIFMKVFAEKYCLFSPASTWYLMHSRTPEVVNLVNSGSAFLSRLEGDLWFF